MGRGERLWPVGDLLDLLAPSLSGRAGGRCHAVSEPRAGRARSCSSSPSPRYAGSVCGSRPRLLAAAGPVCPPREALGQRGGKFSPRPPGEGDSARLQPASGRRPFLRV